MQNIRNFCIIAHIDSGKSTLADRLLELTGTVEKRKMQEQFLDQMELERERGITIKLAPVTMRYKPVKGELDHGLSADLTRTNTDGSSKLLYEDLTYQIRGAAFLVKKELGLGQKEIVYQKALEIELKKYGLQFESQKDINVTYDKQKIGVYTPDFIIEDKVIVELKSLPEIGKPQEQQLWSYLKSSKYPLALLINFGSKDISFKRIIRKDPNFFTQSPHQSASSPHKSAEVEYILNLIDTPGHVDFSYEVSRSLAAVEGAILLVDATKGVQAQTLANLHLAQNQGLAIIPVINKIDLPNARIIEVEEEIQNLLQIEANEILKISAKTGENVESVLEAVINLIPPPSPRQSVSGPSKSAISARALIFDSSFDSYKGVIAYVRVFDGEVWAGDKIKLFASKAESDVVEVGHFTPALKKEAKLSAGEIGYIATGLKDPGLVRVGDTLTHVRTDLYGLNADQHGLDTEIHGPTRVEIMSGESIPNKSATYSPRKSVLSPSKSAGSGFQPLPGYKEPKPVVFASFYPESSDDHDLLKDALSKLKLTDASLTYEPESSAGLGRGFRLGFLGMLHVEIISERLRREFGLSLVISTPSVEYHVINKNGESLAIRSPSDLPDPSKIERIEEPIVNLEILTPVSYMGAMMKLLSGMRSQYQATDYLSKDVAILKYLVPLAEIITDFYDQLKSASSGYASMNYEPSGYEAADLVRLDILVAEELVEPFSKIVPREKAYYEGRRLVEKLKEVLPRQWFAVSLQAAIGGKIIARETIPALRKDVTGYLYGGDVTRKKKLLEKQKRGKARMKERGRVEIPQRVFLEMLKK